MEELVRTNDLVTLSVIGAILDDLGIVHFTLDEHMSVLEGSLGMLPRRLMVDADEADRARRVLVEAGLGHELRAKP